MTTLHEVNTKARQALLGALGPVDYARYLQQFGEGSGDYTADRTSSPGLSTADVIDLVEQTKRTGQLPPPPSRSQRFSPES